MNHWAEEIAKKIKEKKTSDVARVLASATFLYIISPIALYFRRLYTR